MGAAAAQRVSQNTTTWCHAGSEMRRHPDNPRYVRAEYPDDWGRFLLPGLLRTRAKEDLIIRNKVGQAHGLTIENAYVHDRPTARAFFLAAVIYTNLDGILNGDRFEYQTVALPFMADLGEAVARTLWGATDRRSR